MKLEGDLLDRSSDMRYLTEYLISASEQEIDDHSFVLNINSEWGYGKSFLLKGWHEELKSMGFPSAYFDAWKTDFSNEPLLSFISEVSSQLKDYGDEEDGRVLTAVNDFKKSAVRITKRIAPFVLNVLAKKATGFALDEIGDVLTEEDSDQKDIVLNESSDGSFNLTKSSIDTLKITLNKLSDMAVTGELEDYSLRRDSIANFEESLRILVDLVTSKELWGKPLFIFVDELDRCRPTYAIELLESIKHLFHLKEVVFVVATDSTQLSHSIKAVYGEGFNSVSYLKRFFDVEYKLKPPNRLELSRFLISTLGKESREKFFVPSNLCETHEETLIQIFNNSSDCFNLNARDQLKVFEILKSATYVGFREDKIHFILFLIMSIMFYKYGDVYKKFVGAPGTGIVNAFIKEHISDGDLSKRNVWQPNFETSD